MHFTGQMVNRLLKWQHENAAYALTAMIAIGVAMQVELVFSKSINWDEFFHFSEIHSHLLNRSAQWLQVPYVWLFSWMPSLPGDNITHIQIIRLLTLLFELATVALIAAAVMRIAGREEALFCGLLYVTGGYVFLHAFSVRGDMIAAALLMAALWIFMCRPLRGVETTACVVLVALAFVSTIKSVLYAPAFLGVALFRMKKPAHRWILVALTAAVIAAGALVLRLAPVLPSEGAGGLLRDIGMLGRDSVARMFSAGLFPQPEWLRRQVLMAPLLSAALVLAFVGIIASRRTPVERILLLCLLLPFCTVAFYRNAFPYHYAFILPPAMIAVAPAVRSLLQRYGPLPLGLPLLAIAALLSVTQDRRVIDRQRTVVAGLHEIFPHPVTYIDDCGMLGDFPRAVDQFASGWALERYRQAGVPIYSRALEAEPVPLFLADSDILSDLQFDNRDRGLLMPEDELAIGNNYIRHWGEAFVAGKRFAAGEEPQEFQIVIPGTYTVEDGQIVIDGTPYSAGDLIQLSRGAHTASGSRATKVTLRWGDHLRRPAYAWPNGRLFTEF
jgi:hypothetical protein